MPEFIKTLVVAAPPAAGLACGAKDPKVKRILPGVNFILMRNIRLL